MSQGVFVIRTYEGMEGLRAEVLSRPEFVFVIIGDRTIRLGTREAYRKRIEMAMLTGDSPPDGYLPIEDLLAPGEERLRSRLEPGRCFIRPKSKKELKEAVQDSPGLVILQPTGREGEYAGPLLGAPKDRRLPVAGPDPLLRRSWFGEIVWSERKEAWTCR